MSPAQVYGPMVKEVTDCGNLQNEGIRSGWNPRSDKVAFSTFVNHGVYSKNFSGMSSNIPIEKCRCLMRWVGLFSGTGNVSSHLAMCMEVKRMAWKRCRRHDGVHDLDTRAHDWRHLKPVRWSKISSMISCGILGTVTALVFAEVRRFDFEVSSSIQGVDRRRNGSWALSLVRRSYYRATGHFEAITEQYTQNL